MNTEGTTELGEVIARARRGKGLTREELAARLKCSWFSVLRWEQGKQRPIRSLLTALEKELDIDLSKWKR